MAAASEAASFFFIRTNAAKKSNIDGAISITTSSINAVYLGPVGAGAGAREGRH